MTSNRSQNDPPAGRNPANRNARRLDEGDLWADEPGSGAAATPPPARREPAPEPPATPAPVRPAAPSRPAPARATRRSAPQAQAPLPPSEPAIADDYEYEEEDLYYDEGEPPSLLSNPYVLAALAVGGAIVLAVIVVLFFGRGDGESPAGGTTANATRTPTPTVEGDTSPTAIGLMARSIAISTVREGPALSYLELGTLPSQQDVDVVGRNEEATWFQIVFPSGTQLRGWVPDSALKLPDNVAALVDVAVPTPVTKPDVPTATTAPVVEDTPTPTATTTTTEGSPTPAGGDGPDLAVFIASDCTAGSEIKVVITNAGTEALVDEPIEVIVSNDGVAKYQQSFEAKIAVGATANLNTGVLAEPEKMEVSVVLKNLDDVDLSNNITGCTVE